MQEIIFPSIVIQAYSHEDDWILADYFHKVAGFKTIVVHSAENPYSIFHFATILPNGKIIDISGVKTVETFLVSSENTYGEKVSVETIESYDKFLALTDELKPEYDVVYPMHIIAKALLEKYAPTYVNRLKAPF